MPRGGLRAKLPDPPIPQYGSEVEELQQHLAVAKEVQEQLRTEVSLGGWLQVPLTVRVGFGGAVH